jgi:energy-coupling factor transport system ATP-binding protein
VVVMEQGKIIQEGTPATIFSDLDHLRALKLIIPEPLALAQRLRSAGFTISRNAMTIAEIAQEVAHA